MAGGIMNQRGCFILLEGLDRCGKSTQTDILASSLRSAIGRLDSVTTMKFPERSSPIGSFIGSYLSGKGELEDTSCHLLFSADRWEEAGKIRRIIGSGNHIVCDRYAYSGVAFTAAKGSRSVEWCKGADRGLPKPDIVIFLDISVNEAERRGGYGEERFETKEFQEKVYKVYLQLKADDEGAENGVGTRWSIVDACQSVDSVAKDILKAANEAICRPRPEELGELWKNRLHIIG